MKMNFHSIFTHLVFGHSTSEEHLKEEISRVQDYFCAGALGLGLGLGQGLDENPNYY